MSDPSAFGFGQFVPGFDFLQNLSKTASTAQPTAAAGMPGMASWVAPTLSVEDIDKRIQELKSVLFWLEQNTTALKATIQAMEVQKMTLTTLQSMNVNMADLAKAFTARPPSTSAEATGTASSTASSASAGSPPKTSLFTPKPESPSPSTPPSTAQASAHASADPSQAEPAQDNSKVAVDPMQWWGALTQQFQGIAAAALKDVAGEALKAGVKTPSAKARKASTGTRKRTAQARSPAAAKTSAASRSAAKTNKSTSARSKPGPSAGRKTPSKSIS